MQKQPDKPRLWCIFNADSGHWKLVNYEKQHEAVNASTAYTRGYEVHEMLCRSDVEAIIREAREAAVEKERERAGVLRWRQPSERPEKYEPLQALLRGRDELYGGSFVPSDENLVGDWIDAGDESMPWEEVVVWIPERELVESARAALKGGAT